jgi:hypothetical protein
MEPPAFHVTLELCNNIHAYIHNLVYDCFGDCLVNSVLGLLRF